jgi:general secretion pathway protein D
LPAGRRPVGTPVSAPGAARGQFSFNFDDADVYSVIQTVFGDVLKVNYIVDSRVKGRVTFRSVAPVPRDNVLPLMEVILRLNGIAVVEDAGLYRIIPLSDIAREPSPVGIGRDSSKVLATGKALLQVIPISYMSSSEVVKLVTPFLSANAIVVDVPKINHIIVVDTDASVKRVLALVDIFDSEQQKQKRPQVFVYSVQNGKANDITALLQQIFLGTRTTTPTQPTSTTGLTPSTTTSQTPRSPSTTAPSPPPPLPMTTPHPQAPGAPGGATVLNSAENTRIFSNEVTNSIIVLATPEDYQTIKETISKIDIVPRQVVIEGIIAQVNLTDNLSLGVGWLFKASSGDLKGLIMSRGGALAAIDPATTAGTGFTFVALDNAGLVRALVDALATESKGRVLAAPHILVSDNREARIQVGQSVPIVTSQTYGAVGVAPQQVVEYRDIGVILKVKPQVNESGLVTLDINQEVSTYFTQSLYVDSTQIVLNKTEASSNLVVQDGQTIVIGGLIREDTTRESSGIPYLSKIPVLGYLFGRQSKDVTRTEIIMLLTPRVLRNQKEAKDVATESIDKFTERGSIKKEDLQWVRPPAKQSTQPEDTQQNPTPK